MINYINTKLAKVKSYLRTETPKSNYGSYDKIIYKPEDGFDRIEDKIEYHLYDLIETDHCPCNSEFNTHLRHQILRDEENL